MQKLVISLHSYLLVSAVFFGLGVSNSYADKGGPQEGPSRSASSSAPRQTREELKVEKFHAALKFWAALRERGFVFPKDPTTARKKLLNELSGKAAVETVVPSKKELEKKRQRIENDISSAITIAGTDDIKAQQLGKLLLNLPSVNFWMGRESRLAADLSMARIENQLHVIRRSSQATDFVAAASARRRQTDDFSIPLPADEITEAALTAMAKQSKLPFEITELRELLRKELDADLVVQLVDRGFSVPTSDLVNGRLSIEIKFSAKKDVQVVEIFSVPFDISTKQTTFESAIATGDWFERLQAAIDALTHKPATTIRARIYDPESHSATSDEGTKESGAECLNALLKIASIHKGNTSAAVNKEGPQEPRR